MSTLSTEIDMWKDMEVAKWTVLAAAVEVAATGLVLFVRPSWFAWLVFGADFSDAGAALGRLTAIALLGLTLATWPLSGAVSPPSSSARALLIYNVLAALYLLYVATGGQLIGILLWPAIVLHAIFSIVLGRAWLVERNLQREDDFSI
ncbi:hypothetical protein [Bradyrhizobium iriomotense]|uniref:Transmembrane protein n=1 Tax=Bradyrhizobium iriomotense TaxID=441950 RepID=A0ABQ6B2H6_9BRAD|nr:hypothetical protein [Bradyrhizobium iriomotense]GLR88031.1 hypothetical protein GCM10007857_47430 [Bradyrhizobium iriomotense]